MASDNKGFIEKLGLANAWEQLSPNQRKMASVVGVVCCVFIGMALLTGGEDKPRTSKKDQVKRSVLTDANTRSIGIDALNAKVKSVEAENSELKKKAERLEGEIQEIRRRRGNDPDAMREIQILKSQIKNLTNRARDIGWEVEDIKDGYVTVPGSDDTEEQAQQSTVKKSSVPKPAPVILEQNADVEDGLKQDPSYYFKTAPVRPASPAPAAGAPSVSANGSNAGGLSVHEFHSESLIGEFADVVKPLTLPSGTILSGVLVNGLDAATGRGARKDPFPVLVRIQKEAILPNHFNADVKECFATLSGFGELSSERAYLRGEKFSCVTNDGSVIEEKFPAYAVGEDGKAGLRGRVVEKTGSLIVKTTLAGFAAGLSEAFDTSPVPVLQTGDVGSDRVYQDSFSKQATRHGASRGASEAFSRLSDYYMDMADQIFPVIEVDAGRSIDIILSSGFTLGVSKNQAIELAKQE